MPKGVYTRTKKVWNKGKKLSEKHRESLSKAHKGVKLSDETRRRMSKSRMGHPGYTRGLKYSEEIKQKLSKIAKEKKFGKWMIGKKLSQETKDKIRKANSGANGPGWKGGISNNQYPIDWTDILRQSIRERDNYACKICGKPQSELVGMHKKLSVHHVDYDKHNLNPNNLITLCVNCHLKTNHNREKWIEYFKM